MAQVLSQCRGRTKFEQFKRGLARNDMVRAIQRCDRQMIRMFDRFMVSKTSFFSLFVLKRGLNVSPLFLDSGLAPGTHRHRLPWCWISAFSN